MKILITGATGFIGKYVYPKLIEANYDTCATSRTVNKNDSNFYQIDILNHEQIKKFVSKRQPDVLIHLAWDVTPRVFWSAPNNIDYAKASINLFDAFIKNGGKKIIAAGTCAEYPMLAKAVREEESYDGSLSLYGEAKKMLFQYLEKRRLNKEIDLTWFRIFALYGPGEDAMRFFPKAIFAIKNQTTFILNNPNTFYDYIYVEDLASFIMSCVSKEGYGPINIGSGNSQAISDIFSAIRCYIERGVVKEFHDIRVPAIDSRIPNCSKLHHLGFRFRWSQGFQQSIFNKIYHERLP